LAKNWGCLKTLFTGSLSPDQIANAEFNLHPVGCGPYQFDHLLTENGQISGVVLTSFGKYFGAQPYIPQVVFRYVPTSRAGFEAYRQGEVLGISQITPDVLPDALQEPNLSLYTSRLPELSLIFLNLNNGEVAFFQEKEIRKALTIGLNRQRMIDVLLEGQAIPADSPILPGTAEEAPGAYKDVDRVVEAMERAGVSAKVARLRPMICVKG